MKKRVLVVGAAGVIGLEAVRQLRNAGFYVEAWDDMSNATEEPEPSTRLVFRSYDASWPLHWDDAEEDYYAVVNCASPRIYTDAETDFGHVARASLGVQSALLYAYPKAHHIRVCSVDTVSADMSPQSRVASSVRHLVCPRNLLSVVYLPVVVGMGESWAEKAARDATSGIPVHIYENGGGAAYYVTIDLAVRLIESAVRREPPFDVHGEFWVGTKTPITDHELICAIEGRIGSKFNTITHTAAHPEPHRSTSLTLHRNKSMEANFEDTIHEVLEGCDVDQ